MGRSETAISLKYVGKATKKSCQSAALSPISGMTTAV